MVKGLPVPGLENVMAGIIWRDFEKIIAQWSIRYEYRLKLSQFTRVNIPSVFLANFTVKKALLGTLVLNIISIISANQAISPNTGHGTPPHYSQLPK